jgi:hypothetical protein
VNQTLSDYYRLPSGSLSGIDTSTDYESTNEGFFRFGAENVCYGQSAAGVATNLAGSDKFDALQNVHLNGSELWLPFVFSKVIDNLRLEHYRHKLVPPREVFVASEATRQVYYLIRNFLPVVVRRELQRVYFSDWKELPFPAWPVDFTVDNLHEELLKMSMRASGVKKIPFIWFWPNGAPNCLMMTHDVESRVGRDFTSSLMDLDDSYGMKASFQVIPEKRYQVPDGYVREIRDRGFEFNVHDLNHDGHLYRERGEFVRRAARINGYVRKYNCQGFRAGAMYRNQDWYDVFEFSYDMSVPNVAHLEPMRGGCCTVMPYFVGKILELPLTAAQDYALFHILNDYSINLWKKQLALLRQRHGLMSFIAHPDYLIERRARKVYESLLEYLRQLIAQENIWMAFPAEVDRWWRARSQMNLVPRGNNWEIVGPEKEKARLAYAILDDNRLEYELAEIDVSKQSQ